MANQGIAIAKMVVANVGWSRICYKEQARSSMDRMIAAQTSVDATGQEQLRSGRERKDEILSYFVSHPPAP